MERIRRAGSRASEGSPSLDIGFRALKIDSSSRLNTWLAPDELSQAQLTTLEDSIRPDRSTEDLLFQVLVDWGLELSMQLRTEHHHGHEIILVEEDVLIACFEKEVNAEVVHHIAARRPLRAAFRDAGFLTDAQRINAAQTFAELSPSTELKVI